MKKLMEDFIKTKISKLPENIYEKVSLREELENSSEAGSDLPIG